MDARRRHILANEARFRAFNTGAQEAAERLGVPAAVACECGREDCAQRLEVSGDEWRDVHRRADRFVVARGHEIEDAEDVVATNERFSVVEKRLGPPAR